MRTLHILAAALIGAAPLAAQQSRPAEKPAAPAAAHAHDPDHAVPGGGALPEGWSLRLDRSRANASDIRMGQMGSTMHIMMGPSAILWRNADRANGSFRASARFTRTKAPAHPESYGLFSGGRALDRKSVG